MDVAKLQENDHVHEDGELKWKDEDGNTILSTDDTTTGYWDCGIGTPNEGCTQEEVDEHKKNTIDIGAGCSASAHAAEPDHEPCQEEVDEANQAVNSAIGAAPDAPISGKEFGKKFDSIYGGECGSGGIDEGGVCVPVEDESEHCFTTVTWVENDDGSYTEHTCTYCGKYDANNNSWEVTEQDCESKTYTIEVGDIEVEGLGDDQ